MLYDPARHEPCQPSNDELYIALSHRQERTAGPAPAAPYTLDIGRFRFAIVKC